MKKINLFLASSSELKAEREQFEIFIYRKCKMWFDKGIFLHLDVWEDFLDCMAPGGLQSEYNKVIGECDIFVLLAFNKVGKFTAEEFETACGEFSNSRKPFIYTYFKQPHTSQNREDLQSLWAFEDKLKALGHYKTDYSTTDALLRHFGDQLDKLAQKGFLETSSPGDTGGKTASEPRITQNHSGSGDNVAGDKIVTNQQGKKEYNIKHIDNADFK